MLTKKQIQKTIVKVKLTSRVSKKCKKAFLDSVKDRVYLRSSEIFDPYTGSAYKEAIEERLLINKAEFKTWAMALREIENEVDEIFETI